MSCVAMRDPIRRQLSLPGPGFPETTIADEPFAERDNRG